MIQCKAISPSLRRTLRGNLLWRLVQLIGTDALTRLDIQGHFLLRTVISLPWALNEAYIRDMHLPVLLSQVAEVCLILYIHPPLSTMQCLRKKHMSTDTNQACILWGEREVTFSTNIPRNSLGWYKSHTVFLYTSDTSRTFFFLLLSTFLHISYLNKSSSIPATLHRKCGFENWKMDGRNYTSHVINCKLNGVIYNKKGKKRLPGFKILINVQLNNSFITQILIMLLVMESIEWY